MVTVHSTSRSYPDNRYISRLNPSRIVCNYPKSFLFQTVFIGFVGRFPFFSHFRHTFCRLCGSVSSLFAFPTHILLVWRGGFFSFRISALHFAGLPGRFLHYLHFCPTFCWHCGAVSSLFAFLPHILLACRGGFFTICISAPHFAGLAGRFFHFSHFRPAFCWLCGAISSVFAFPTHILLALRGDFFTFRFPDPHFADLLGRFFLFSHFRPSFYWHCGAVSSLFAFPTHISLAWRGGFFIFRISDPHFAGLAGRFFHFSHFRPTFRWLGGAVFSFFAFPPHILLALRGGFFIFSISDPHFDGLAGRFLHFLHFRPSFC
jgi:hypothetical protein